MRRFLFLVTLALLTGCYNAAPTTTVVPSNPTVVVPANPTVVQPVETVIIHDDYEYHHHRHHPHSGVGVHVDGVNIDVNNSQCTSDKPCGHCNKCRPSVSIGVDISK